MTQPKNMSADEWASWLLLELGEQGRPEEQVSQFVASMFLVGGEDMVEMLRFFSSVMDRIQKLMDESEDEIWPNLIVGGNQIPLPDPFENKWCQETSVVLVHELKDESWVVRENKIKGAYGIWSEATFEPIQIQSDACIQNGDVINIPTVDFKPLD